MISYSPLKVINFEIKKLIKSIYGLNKIPFDIDGVVCDDIVEDVFVLPVLFCLILSRSGKKNTIDMAIQICQIL